MIRILIPYNLMNQSNYTDQQIFNIINKIRMVFKNELIGIDYVLPQNIVSEKKPLINELYKINNLYIIKEPANNIDYQNYVDKVCKIAAEESYNYIFIPTGGISKVLAACLSVDLKVGVTVDVLDIYFENRQLQYMRATSSNELLAFIKCMCSTEIATLKLKNVDNKCKNISDLSECKHIYDLFFEKSKNIKISNITDNRTKNSDIVIGVGRGVSKETLKGIIKFSKINNIEIVTTKPGVENGLFEHEKQVGQSGKSINAKLYIAIGISGAMQHIVGIMGCKYIIAINPDKDAPIHKYADVSIVSHAEKVFDSS